MKRIGYIYEKVYDKANIKLAIKNASKKKTKKRMVKWVNKNIDYCVDEIHDMLKNKTYIPSPYNVSTIIDRSSQKERLVHKPRFYPDQVIHWCLMNVIEPILSRGLYKWNCASIKTRGPHYAKRACEKWVRNDIKNTKYCLKLDITKYYPNIDQDLLKQKFRRIIKDNNALWLMDVIVDSVEKGLPIGNYTSQWFANFYLQKIDHYIKQELEISHYIRYMDDLVLFGSNKRKLRKAFVSLTEKLGFEKASIKDNYQIFNIDKRRLDFCGFVFGRKKTFVRKRITRNMRRSYFKYKKKKTLKNAQSLMSYYGWLIHTDSYVLYKKYYLKIMKQLKEVIRNGEKEITIKRHA